MVILLKKTLRDFKRNLFQFFSIFILIFISFYVYTGISSEYLGIEKEVNKFYEDTNFLDSLVYTNTPISETNFDKIKNLTEIKEASRRLYLKTTLENDINPDIDLYIIEENTISKMYLIEGIDYGNEIDGVYLDYRFALASNIKLGDIITFCYQEISLKKQVVALILSPEYVYRDNDSMTSNFALKGYAFISTNTFSKSNFFISPMIYNQLLIKTNTNNFKEVEKKVGIALDGKYTMFLERENLASYKTMSLEISQHKSLALMLPPIFLIISLLIVMTTMKRIINKEKVGIATLKAIGFRNKTLFIHYGIYGFLISAIAVVLSYILGPVTIPYLFYPSMSLFYTIPNWIPYRDNSFIFIALTIIILTIVTVLLSTRKIVMMPCVDGLKSFNSKKFSNKHLLSLNKVPFSIKWNLRDIRRNALKTIMSIFGSIGTTGILICALTFFTSMQAFKSLRYDKLYLYKTKISIIDNLNSKKIDNIISLTDGYAVIDKGVEVLSDTNKYVGNLRISDPNNPLLSYVDSNFQPVQVSNSGIAITYKLKSVLSVDIGDTITWHILGEEVFHQDKIVQILRDPTSQGIIMSKEYFQSLGYEPTPSYVVSSLYSDSFTEIDGVQSILKTSDDMKFFDDMLESFNILIYLLIIASIALSIIVLFNLGTLSYLEMFQDIATLKTIGFQSSFISNIILIQNLFLSTIGFILGIPVGLFIAEVSNSTMGEGFDMAIKLNFLDIVLAAGIFILVIVINNYSFYKKVKNLNMVEVQKME
ncbi:MAG: ABC transporter permease [Acholeplasmatales bacterium]|jgi:putative ABC transport system permease protein|nr:ABC transporter permease [Acholeplasmatales bacterium]